MGVPVFTARHIKIISSHNDNSETRNAPKSEKKAI